MKTQRAAILLAAVLLGLSGFAVLGAPTARAAPTRSFILYGDAVDGWGFTTSSISTPGPTLVVNAGDLVSIELFANDSATHTWFIDYDNNSATNAGEPTSGQFHSATTPTWYNFTADAAHVGTWTYRCAIHPNTMKGLIVILAAPTYLLYGSMTDGWGLTSTSLHNPGPSLTVTAGQTVTFELVSQDGVAHTLFIDLNNNSRWDANEPQSPEFGGAGNPQVISWTWIASIPAGSYKYLCGIHTTAMEGNLTVASSTPPPPPVSPPDYTLYAAIVVVVAIVAVAVVVFIRRKPRTPPEQPPTPPQ